MLNPKPNNKDSVGHGGCAQEIAAIQKQLESISKQLQFSAIQKPPEESDVATPADMISMDGTNDKCNLPHRRKKR